jgi:hypothetical protein
MITVYRVLPDAHYQRFEPVDTEAALKLRRTKWRFDGTTIGKDWRPPEVYVQQPLLLKPDIWGTFAGSHVLAFGDKAADVLQLFLDQAGEQLPLYHEGRKLVLLNVTYVLNCLDARKSKYDPDLPHMIDKYVFQPERLEYSLFKIPETRMSELLAVEGLAAPSDEFKAMVEQEGLTGLQFQKMWSSDPQRRRR